MSAMPEDPEDSDKKVSDSLTLNLYDGLQSDLSATGMWKNISHII